MSEHPALLGLPHEIRHEIYKTLLAIRGEILVGYSKEAALGPRTSGIRQSLGLLFACRQLYAEFSVFIYSHTIFDLVDAADSVVSFLEHTPEHLLASIRCLVYGHDRAHPLTDSFPSELQRLMAKTERNRVKRCMSNFNMIFGLIKKKLAGPTSITCPWEGRTLTSPGLEAFLICLPIFSGQYHDAQMGLFASSTSGCRYDPCPYLETLRQVQTLRIPYISLTLFTVCTTTICPRRGGLQPISFEICGDGIESAGRLEWMEDAMKGDRAITWRYLRPLLKLADRDDEYPYLFDNENMDHKGW